jgi:hypothetical protein
MWTGFSWLRTVSVLGFFNTVADLELYKGWKIYSLSFYQLLNKDYFPGN